MEIGARRIKIFKIKNRRGFGCIFSNHLTEGKTIVETYDRMLKALRRSGIKVKDISNLKSLLTNV
ncbi:MAG: hypothetical protein M0R20_05825 [Candidatus Omnitrophica bacterium]|jgi:hypothetical protein|nr:hypothetical protein [Candidatus Omnitrophota bacterium]